MEQYPVPQFIEQESKIVFFLSFRQFIYLLVTGGICFSLYYVLPFPIFVVVAGAIALVGISFAFLTINGIPLQTMVLSSLGFATGGKSYTWKKRESPYPFRRIKRAAIKKIDQGPVLQAQESQLRKTRTSIELRTK